VGHLNKEKLKKEKYFLIILKINIMMEKLKMIECMAKAVFSMKKVKKFSQVNFLMILLIMLESQMKKHFKNRLI
jgi:hypothetical protein